MFDISFYKGKKVFVTGHTGFKGSWLCKMLVNAGAEVTGYSLNPPTSPSLFEVAGLEHDIHSVIGDIRDLAALKAAFDAVQPEIVLHLAAQPIVRDSYKDPVYTYETNVMGTVNILECVRQSNCVRSFLNVTTDKVYLNKEWAWGYRENEELDGYDPYSNSKSCSELVTHSYKNSFFADGHVAISTARAGNVIGGGDFANDRIIPDCVRAAMKGEDIIVRNPFSTRPYQHVLEPLYAYLMIAAKQYEDGSFAGYYNVGPDDVDCFQTGALVDLFVSKWGEGLKWINRYDGGPHEANFLKLDCSKLKTTFDWKPRWNLDTAIEKVVEWTKCWAEQGDVRTCMDEQINVFLNQEGDTRMPFEFHETEIKGLVVITPHMFPDQRGLYKKCYEKNVFAEHGIICNFTESSDLYSAKGALRGLHYQTEESQAKLIHVISGILFDVAIDLREGSETFGQYHTELIDARDQKTVFIPEGFAHGFIALTDNTVFSYQCSGRYVPAACGGILWSDPDLNIPWPLKEYGIDHVIATEKDQSWPTLQEYIERNKNHA